MKIVIPDGDTLALPDMQENIIREFSRFGEVICNGTTKPEEVISRIQDAEIVLCNKTPITREVIAQCRNLKYIGLFATGYNNIDLQAASERNIIVCNAGAYSTEGVVQHTFALLLDLAGNLPAYHTSVRNGEWERSPVFSYFPHPVHELYGKTFAVIGFGSIGKRVAQVASAFSMKVIVYTRTIPEDPAVNYPDYEFVTQEEAFRRADVLSIHCPLTEQTANFISKETLALMKPTAYFINTARGGIVCEQDLADALNQGRLAGAGLDVLVQEPMSPDTPLKSAKNCLITPHIAWSAVETRERLIRIVVHNLECYLDGKPVNQVN
ncbi:MAG: D-2-hydroxyacid dehydrogenase [Oscillospiraceae bacterium]|nr:D-2-hydroxyacid dehydrogenase [Oscillospiraceae bacterium]